MNRMRAAVITSPRQLRIDHVPLPAPPPGHVRIRLQHCGVCTSNLPPWEGRPWFEYPMEAGALGHEGCGHIDVIGDEVTGLRPGQRVAALSYRAYAEYDIAPADAVVPLPAALDALPFPGEPLGCAMNIFKRSGITAGQNVAIVGMGFLGHLLHQLATNVGARVFPIAGRSGGPAATGTTLLAASALASIRELTGGKLCDVVIEATGLQQPLDLAGELTAERGRLIIAGYHQDGPRQINLQLWNWRGLDVINAHERDPRSYVAGIRDAVDAVTRGRLDPTPLFTHRFPLEELPAAFTLAQQRPPGFFKALIEL